MRAIVQDRYGSEDVYRVAEIDRPMVGESDVLVRVHAASLHADVWHMMRGLPYILRLMGGGLRRPKNPVPGIDMAGTAEAVGDGVDRFRPGDAVFGQTIKGIQWQNGGAFAEYVAVPEEVLAPKPDGLSFEEAAAVPASALIALENLGSRARPGRQVLVNGAAGGVGIFAVQLAKAAGAEVTAVDRGDKLDMLRSIGADRVMDYAKEDFTRTGDRYEVIVDIPGNHSVSELRRAMTPDGVYVLIGHDGYGAAGHLLGSIPRIARLAVLSPFVSQDLFAGNTDRLEDPLGALEQLIDEGKLTPVVDRAYPLAQIGEAMRYLRSGDVKGKIVLTV